MRDLTPQAIALLSAFSYASGVIFARRGMRFSNPTTLTFLSVIVQTITLWTAVWIRGGAPASGGTLIVLATVVGLLMPVVRILSYTGVAKIGAPRSASLRSTHPLFSTLIALTILHEQATLSVVLAIVTIVMGIALISWQPEASRALPAPRWWYPLYPVGGALLAGIVHPIARTALTRANHPLFFAALVGLVSLLTFSGYLLLPDVSERPQWKREGLFSLAGAAACETLGFLLFSLAIGSGPVVLVTPIVATQPMWVLLASVVLLRDLELVTLRTTMGTVAVVAGTVTLTLTHS